MLRATVITRAEDLRDARHRLTACMARTRPPPSFAQGAHFRKLRRFQSQLPQQNILRSHVSLSHDGLLLQRWVAHQTTFQFVVPSGKDR